MRTLKATLVTTTSLAALLLGGCATDRYAHEDTTARYYAPRAPSARRIGPPDAHGVRIKSATVVRTSHGVRATPVAARISTVSEPPNARISDPVRKQPISADSAPPPVAPVPATMRPDPAPRKAVEADPRPIVVPKIDAPVTAAVEPPKVAATPPRQVTAPLIQTDPAALPQARAVPVPPPAPPRIADVKPPEVKPAETKAPEPKVAEPVKAAVVKAPEAKVVEQRSLTEIRQAPAATPPAVPQASISPPVAQPLPQAAAPTAPPVRQAAIEPAPAQALPMSAKQRAQDALARAADYMASGRIVNARSLLEDQAKTGDAAILKALGETYDPLHLRDAYPKLARAGDPAKAMAAYEQAKSAGAKDLETRIDALRAFMATKQ